ncbi:MAG: chlorite dismutase family protein [Nitrospira sp.]
MTRSLVTGLTIIWLLVGPWASNIQAAADREKLLTEPGVYGTFAVFALNNEEWAKQDPATRILRLTSLKGVVEQHREHVIIDLYLLRGLSDHGDLLFRIHAAELYKTQEFLLDLKSSQFGKHLKTVGIMHGLTKQPTYVPGFPDQMKDDLNTISDPGQKPYAVVIPIRKSAVWWGLDQENRVALMQEHTAATLPYVKTVKRKLYLSSGLDDQDFIAYFETSKLEDFHNLVLSLEQVQEFRYTRRFGHPIILGTMKSLDEVVELLAQ